MPKKYNYREVTIQKIDNGYVITTYGKGYEEEKKRFFLYFNEDAFAFIKSEVEK